MNTVVYKYPLELGAGLQLPASAEILHVDAQGGQATLWALVDPDAEMEVRDVYLVGTGHPMPELAAGARRVHLGSFLVHGGVFVFHAFEDVQP